MWTYYRTYPRRRSAQFKVKAEGARHRLPLDVVAEDEAYIITAAVPGLKPEDLKIEVLEDVVTLRGETRPQEAEQGHYLLRELHFGPFERRLRLPDVLDAAQAEAQVDNGLLTLRIPKAEQSRPKTIKVQAR